MELCFEFIVDTNKSYNGNKTANIVFDAQANISIDWGDNSGITTANDLYRTHIYSNNGVYHIKVYDVPADVGTGLSGATSGERYYNAVIYTSAQMFGNRKLIVRAFYNCSNLTEFIFDNFNAGAIPEGAFGKCSALKRINSDADGVFNLPDGLTSIENSSFVSCALMTSLALPSSLTRIGLGAFNFCTGLKRINSNVDGVYNIPEGVVSIGDCFRQCSYMKELTLPSTITTIGKPLLYELSRVDTLKWNCENTDFESGSTGAMVFGCPNLTKIVIGSSVKRLPSSAFDSISTLTRVDYDGNIDNWAEIIFENEKANPLYYANQLYIEDEPIVNVSISYASKVMDYAFYNCNTINRVILQDGVETVKVSAFENCSGITNVTLSSSLNSIEANAFNGCSALVSKYYTGTQDSWSNLLNNIGINNAPLLNATLYLTKLFSWNTNGGTLEQGFDNPMLSAVYPNPLPTCSRGNFVFGGWFADNNFTQQIVAGEAVSTAMVYAKIQNNINYVLNGGSNSSLNKPHYSPMDVDKRKTIYAPIKAGYEFAGWYTESSFQNQIVDMSDLADGNSVTLYAKFKNKESNKVQIKDENGSLKDVPIDARTVRGHDAYVNINLETVITMGDLDAIISDINAKNEHAIFDASSFIDGAYVCLISIQKDSGVSTCEIIDMLNSKVYYNSDGFILNQTIGDYLNSCVIKDNYTNISLSGVSTLGELRSYINKINASGGHCLFDMHSYIDGAYVCTVQMYERNGINYCFIFDILNGKLYGSYTGYNDDITVVNYCNSTISDVVHAIKITNSSITLQEIINLVNRVNQIDHHVFFDISALSDVDYLITFTYQTTGNNTICKFMGLVNGTTAKQTYSTNELSNVTFAEFLSTGGDFLMIKNIFEIGEDGQKSSSNDLQVGGIFFENLY